MTETLTVSRIIRAAPKSVFEAWTNPELLVKWWGPGTVSCPEAHVDLKAGGKYSIANLHADGKVIWIKGTFSEVTPPEKLIYDWQMNGGDAPSTLVTVLFNEHPEGTEIVLTHQRFVETAQRDMHLSGWGGCIDKLEAMFA